MRTRLACLALLAASCTCQPSFEPDPQCQTDPMPPTAVLLTGQPGTVRVGVSTVCFTSSVAHLRPDFRQPTDVLVEVFDPDNRAVPFTVTRPERVGDQIVFEVSSQVTFTPDRPGVWTVTARFEPGIGATSLAVPVAANRADAGVVVVPVALPNCAHYGLLANGAVACVRLLTPTTSELAIGTGRWPGARFVIDGAQVFRLARGAIDWELDRLAEDAGAFSPVLAFSGAADEVPVFGARADVLWLARNLGDAGFSVSQGQPADGGYAWSARRVFDLTADQVFVLEGRAILAAHPTPGAKEPFLGSDGGFQRPNPGGMLVSVPSDGGAPVTTEGPMGPSVWADEAGGWIFGPPTIIAMSLEGPSTLTAVDLGSGAIRLVSMQIAQSMQRPAGPLSPASPVFPLGTGATTGVLVAGPTAIGYEIYDPGPDYAPVTSATRSHAFARSADGKTVKVFSR